MTLAIGRAIARGASRTTTTAGLVLAAIYAVYAVVTTAAVNTAVVEAVDAPAADPGVTLPLSAGAAGIVSAVGYVVGAVLIVGITRTMVREEAELSSVPTDAFTRRIGRATAVTIVTAFVAGVAITLGFVLVVPGFFLLVSFLFAFVLVAVEDEGVIGSLRGSWRLASGHRWRLLVIAVVLLGIQFAATVVGTVVGVVDPAAGQVASALLSGVFVVLSTAIVADAYLQLRDERGGPEAARTPDATGGAVA